jgi:hypothetical protein
VGWQAPERVHTGQSAVVTFYFRTDAPITRDWRLFVHGDPSPPTPSVPRIHLDHFPSADHDSTVFWRPGEIVQDEVALDVPSDYGAAAIDVWLGLYRGIVRMHASDAGAAVARDRAPGPHIVVDHAPASG